MNAAVATNMPVTSEVTSDYSGSLTPTTSGEEDSEEEEEEEDEQRVSESTSLLWAGTGAKKTAFIMFRPESLISKDKRLKAIGEKFHLAYKMVKTESKLVRSVLSTYGFHEVHPNSPDFNLMWTGAHLKPFSLRSLQDFQKVNHFPRSYEITRKDRLFKNVDRMAHTKGMKHFDFMPKSYLMPSEYQDFCAAYAKDKGPWIVKPIASSRGRGIYLINNPNQVPLEDNIMVCKYISNPLLIDGFKFDIRVYIAVTSYDPLIVYLFEEGLTRCEDPDVEDYGNKWSMSAMLRYLKQEGIDTSALMMRIEAVIIKAIIAAELPIATACKMFVPHRENCMELYGFDILVDENLKPWLLEGNLSPSLACDAPLDLKIKSCMVSDFFSLVGFQCVDPLTRRQKKDQTRRPYSASKGLSGVSSMQGTQVKRPVSASGPKEPSVSGLSGEETKILRMAKEQYQRRGSFIRIFPTPETWELYGSFLEYKSNHNLMLAQKLFPERARSKVSGAYSSAVARMRSIASGQLLEGRNRVMSERFLQYERKLLSLETLKNKRTKKTVTKKRKKETPIGVDNRTLAQGQLRKVTRDDGTDESEEDEDGESDADSDISDDPKAKKGHQKSSSVSQSSTKISSASTTRSKKSASAKTSGPAGDLNPLTKSAYASIRSKDAPVSRPPSQGSSVIASSSKTSISSRSGTAKSGRKVDKPQEVITQKQTVSQRIYTYKNLKQDAAGDTKSNGTQEKRNGEGGSISDSDSSDDEHRKGMKMKQHEHHGKATISSAKQNNATTPRTAKQQKKAFDVLHALKSGGNLGKVQARQAFSAYLSRVQQRLMAESESHSQDTSETVTKQEEQMDLVLRFLKRAAGNLRQSFAVVVPSRRLSLPDRKRILAKQLGDFVHIYNKETDVLEHKQSLGLERDITSAWSESVQDSVHIKETDFRYFVLTASEPELEEVLTTYTHKNKSASVFLGASKPKSREKREVSTPSTVASTSRLSSRGKMAAVDHFPSTQSLVHTGHMYQSEEHREDLYELNLHRRSQSAFSTLRMRSPSPAASTTSMSIRNPYHPSATYLHPAPGSNMSSLQQASYIYNSKLTPPTSVTNAVASQNSAQKRPSSAHDYNNQTNSQVSNVATNPTGTRPTSASNGRVPVGGSLHYQTAANEEAIADALQKLAERQAARQYSATSQLQALTQHLSNINLANLSASRQQLAHRASSLSDLASTDPAVQSMMEPSSWDVETTNKYASRPPPAQPQVLAQQSKELLQQSKAKHQAMVAQVARMVDDFGSQLKLEFQSAIENRGYRRCSFLDSLLTEGEEEGDPEGSEEGCQSTGNKLDRYDFLRSKLPETSYYYRKAADPSIIVQNSSTESLLKKSKPAPKISMKKKIDFQQHDSTEKKIVKENSKNTYKPSKYSQKDEDVRPKSRAERVWISYHEYSPKKTAKSPRSTKQVKQSSSKQKSPEAKNCTTCGTITFKNAMDLAKNSPQSENIIKGILSDMKGVFSSGDSPCKQWVYKTSGSPCMRSWMNEKKPKKKAKKAHNMVSAGVEVRSPYTPQSGDDVSNALRQRPGSASVTARPPQVPRPPEKPKPTEKTTAPAIRKPLGNTTKFSHVGNPPPLTGLSPNPSSIKSNEDRQRNFYNSLKYDTSTGQTKFIDRPPDSENARSMNNTAVEGGSRPSSARRPLWKP